MCWCLLKRLVPQRPQTPPRRTNPPPNPPNKWVFSRPPEPLPADRRPLTPTPDNNKRAHNQSQSLLFSKLPLDIRLLIYTEVLAPPDDELLHVGTTDQRLCSTRCSEKPDGLQRNKRGWQHRCWGYPTINDGTISRDYDLHPENLSGLLCSCRRIYAESIDILYTRNVIQVHQTRPISEFPIVMTPDRLATIRHLHLDTWLCSRWRDDMVQISDYHRWPSNVLIYWEAACLVIQSKMPGLLTFRVSLGVREKIEGLLIEDYTIAKALGYLMPIGHVPEFLVEFHWQRDLDPVFEKLGVSREDLPFKVAVYDIGDQSTDSW